MSTKYFLHGGFASDVNNKNDSFFKDVLKDAPENLRVLLVYFAKEDDKIKQSESSDIAQFVRNSCGKSITFDKAKEDKVVDQIRMSDIIYFHGGNTVKLLEKVRSIIGLKELFDGKIVAGESAGAYILSQKFYSKSSGGLFEGLGFVPAQIICHYVGDNADKLKEDINLETLLLADYEYKVFKI